MATMPSPIATQSDLAILPSIPSPPPSTDASIPSSPASVTPTTATSPPSPVIPTTKTHPMITRLQTGSLKPKVFMAHLTPTTVKQALTVP